MSAVRKAKEQEVERHGNALIRNVTAVCCVPAAAAANANANANASPALLQPKQDDNGEKGSRGCTKSTMAAGVAAAAAKEEEEEEAGAAAPKLVPKRDSAVEAYRKSVGRARARKRAATAARTAQVEGRQYVLGVEAKLWREGVLTRRAAARASTRRCAEEQEASTEAAVKHREWLTAGELLD
jgi:hypothetical protein